jgi:hypothetical protein
VNHVSRYLQLIILKTFFDTVLWIAEVKGFLIHHHIVLVHEPKQNYILMAYDKETTRMDGSRLPS